jgi:hypothetical protein
MQFVFVCKSGCLEKLYILILYKLPNPLVKAAKLTVFEPAPTPGKKNMHFAKHTKYAKLNELEPLVSFEPLNLRINHLS